ncbi:hypothetical protein GE107_25375 [Cohnella sp. CFH 77786]|uniref:hypothetical protein n=1 Tax=Cohnella sp. CFH 77786 TaxID=2662265 RepID=UPI001C608684|nr:hypothetical protein [Cohnella sp. CFH 77786]MBW5449362.1 hypothetical protein [Cohnella sp. CFH 77786]
MVQGFIKQAEAKSADELIHELKTNQNYTVEQQGVMIVKLMEKKNLLRHMDVAEILGLSRSYVSIRIAKALKQYPELPRPKRKMGRPRNRTIELDEFIPGQKIPIRLVVKDGSRTSDEQVKKYLELAVKNWPKQP